MEYRKLGNTEIDVSLICLGTMTFGEQNSEAEAHEQLNYALDQGINFIDTAEMYPVPARAETQGQTERFIGSWLKDQDRDKIVLASKAASRGNNMDHLRGGPNFSREHIRTAIEGSLSRLQTEYVDLYQLHWPERKSNFFGRRGFSAKSDDTWTPFEQVLETLKELQEEGKIRYVGLSNETPWGVMQFLRLAEKFDLPKVVSIQNPYSLLNRQFEIGLSEMAIREQVGLLAYSPLAMGMLTGKYRNGAQPIGARLTRWRQFVRYSTDNCFAATDRYYELAEELGISLTQLALAFINAQEFVTANIIGATNMEQLKENIGSINVKLSDEALASISKIHEQYPDPAT